METRRILATEPCALVGRDVSYLALLTLAPLARMERNLIGLERTRTEADVKTDAEALQLTYDPTKLSYQTLLEFLYKMHDPTTLNRQGPDTGSQYRSGIFFHDEEQEKVAREVTKKVQEQWWTKGKVVTEILPAGEWWDAEDYHQRYLDINPGGYECPSQ